MSKADVIFKNMCETILSHGTDTKGQKIRPKWPDGTPAYTIKTFGYVANYDLREEFPAITFRKTGIKSAAQEILWIYQKKSNKIKDLGLTIWDEWADKNETIGNAYGYQVAQKSFSHFYPESINTKMCECLVDDKWNPLYPSWTENYEIRNGKSGYGIYLDQMDRVLYDLKHFPFSRRIMISLWNVNELEKMNLQPCCWSCTFNVTDEGGDKLVLNMVLNQRSQDILAANNWNVCQYAILLMMIAQSVDMIPGVLLHVIADAHIYDKHIDIIKELINREQYPAPKVMLDPDIHSFYQFTKDSIFIDDYITGPQIKNIPIAI